MATSAKLSSPSPLSPLKSISPRLLHTRGAPPPSPLLAADGGAEGQPDGGRSRQGLAAPAGRCCCKMAPPTPRSPLQAAPPELHGVLPVEMLPAEGRCYKRQTAVLTAACRRATSGVVPTAGATTLGSLSMVVDHDDRGVDHDGLRPTRLPQPLPVRVAPPRGAWRAGPSVLRVAELAGCETVMRRWRRLLPWTLSWKVSALPKFAACALKLRVSNQGAGTTARRQGDRGARASRPPPPQRFGCVSDSRVDYGNVVYTFEVD